MRYALVLALLALAGCAASPETIESYAWLAVAVLAAVVVFPLALPVAASFFGGGYIPLRAAAKVALGVVASIAFGLGVGVFLYAKLGFSGYSSSAIAVLTVWSIFMAWGRRLDGSDDDDQD